MPRFGGKTAVVTGASSGIGLAIARRLADEGAHVHLTARRKPQLDEAAADARPNATAVQADVSDLADLDRLYCRIGADGCRLGVVLANAGGGGLATLQQTSEQFFDNAFTAHTVASLRPGTRSFKQTRDPVETGSHASALDVLISVAQMTVRAHN